MVLFNLSHFFSVPASRKRSLYQGLTLAAQWNPRELSLIWDVARLLVALKDLLWFSQAAKLEMCQFILVSINSSNSFSSALWSFHFPQICPAKSIHGLVTRFHQSFSDLLYSFLKLSYQWSLGTWFQWPSLTSTHVLRSSMSSFIKMAPHFT